MSERGGVRDLRRRYVEELRTVGVLADDSLARAFATVPREAFVADGFHGRDGCVITPDHRGFLAAVYRNDVLVTKFVDGVAVSSSSQPSLMAVMIDALGLVPGMRVLEIGAGTGYNAALMATLGARVTTIDVQPDVVRRAGAALAAAGFGAVDVRLGDGYLGHPAGAPYHRVIVTVGVAGVSPHWLGQLTPDGFVLAPVGHAGNHPVLRVCRRADGTVQARGVSPAGFMVAAGPLSARYAGAHPEPGSWALAAPRFRHPGRWRPPLDRYRYHDLWFAVGAWDRRATFAPVHGAADASGCALVDGAGGGAGITRDGSVFGSGLQARRYADEAVALRDRWIRAGRPTVSDWRATMVLAGDPRQPIRVPGEWTLS